MQTPTLLEPKPLRRAQQRLRPDDFQRLGLVPTEARVAVIRRAAGRTAASLGQLTGSTPTERKEAELALIVASVYRLLDPRRRDQFRERIQLLRVDPMPLRSQLLDFDDRADTAPSESAEAVQEEEDSDQHDWMLQAIAELRIEPAGRRGEWSTGAAAPNVPPVVQNVARESPSLRRRRHLLEMARILDADRSRRVAVRRLSAAAACLVVVAVILFAVGRFSQPGLNAEGDSQSATEQADLIPLPSVADLTSQQIDAPIRPTEASVSQPPSVHAGNPDRHTEPKTPGTGQMPVPPNAGNRLASVEDLSADSDVTVPGSGGSVGGQLPRDDRLSSENQSDAVMPAGGSTTSESGESLVAADTRPNSTDVTGQPRDSGKVPAGEKLSSGELPPAASLRLDQTIRHPIPSEAALADAQRQIRNRQLDQPQRFPVGTSTVVEIWKQSEQAKPGSADRLALGLAAGQRAILVGDYAMATAIERLLAEHFEQPASWFGLSMLTSAAADAVTMTEHERIAQWGLRLSGAALASEKFELASEAARLGTAAAAELANQDLRGRLKQRRDAITTAERMAKNYHDESGTMTPETANRSSALNASRHFCVNLGDWKLGLPWMANGSDVRMAALASEELEMPVPATAETLAAVGRRWLELAERRKGHEQESLILHGRDLLVQAAAQLSGVEQLELEKEIQEIDNRLASDLHPLDVDTARARLTGASTVPDQPAITPSPVAGTTIDPQSIGLLGRLLIAGRDTGVLFRFPTHIALPRSAVDTVVRQLAIGGVGMEIEFRGLLVLDSATTVRISAMGPRASDTGAAGSDAPNRMRLMIDQTEVSLGTTGPAETGVIDLNAGAHRIDWLVMGDRFDALQLEMRDDRDNRLLELRNDDVTKLVVERLPVRLRVDFRAR
jgi:hypothetical protein